MNAIYELHGNQREPNIKIPVLMLMTIFLEDILEPIRCNVMLIEGEKP